MNLGSQPYMNRSPQAYPMTHFAIAEESTSTDATPESSDVEEDGGVRRRKRAKVLLSEEQTSRLSTSAAAFPLKLHHIRASLLKDVHDGRISDSTALSALIHDFTRVENDSGRYSLPVHCEIWLKQASDSVHERRQDSKGLRKKKSSEAVLTAGPDEMFYCQLCTEHEAKPYKTQEGVNLHILNKHETDKQWKCFAPDCSVSFVRQSDLRMHLIRMHSPERPYPCKAPFCLKSFAGVSELRRHVKVDHRNLVQQICEGVQDN